VTSADDTPAGTGEPSARELLIELHSLPADSPRRAALRDQLVEAHLPFVIYLARRFSGRSEPLNDLIQVGAIGLIKAVDRFEPERDQAALPRHHLAGARAAARPGATDRDDRGSG
jgi:hypothetical protein